MQGEGPNIGKPAVFLRLAICNLRCQWCDTKYTWDWDNYDYDAEVKDVRLDDVEKEILSYKCKHLVVTGGEPMLQQRALSQLLQNLKSKGFYVEIETSGTILPTNYMVELIDQWNVSPKLENSGNLVNQREKPECYRFFRDLPNSYLKYVIQDPKDVREVQELINEYDLPREKIILMPEATTREQLEERSQWLTEVCKQYGYRFTTRLQIELWGSKRGV